MEVMQFCIVVLCIFVFLELLDFRVEFLEKLGVKPFLIRALVSASVALVIVKIDIVLHPLI